jgi:hypothetical protein
MEIIIGAVIIAVVIAGRVIRNKIKKSGGYRKGTLPSSTGAGIASPSYVEGQEDATEALAAHAEATKNKG